METLERTETFAVRLIRLRTQRKWTTSVLAYRCGFDRAKVDHWETGKYRPSLESLVILHRVLGVSIDYLCGVTDDARKGN